MQQIALLLSFIAVLRIVEGRNTFSRHPLSEEITPSEPELTHGPQGSKETTTLRTEQHHGFSVCEHQSIWSLWEDFRAPTPLAYVTRHWTKGPDGYPLVPYVFQDSINQDDVRADLDHWMEHTCIKFEEETSSNINQTHLQFHIGPKGICNSYVGMVWWQHGQQVSIGEGCNGVTFENIHGCSATDPSAKKHPITDFSTRQPPTTDPPTIQPPTTDHPKTQSSTTDPPPTQPPTTDSPKSQPPTRVAWVKWIGGVKWT